MAAITRPDAKQREQKINSTDKILRRSGPRQHPPGLQDTTHFLLTKYFPELQIFLLETGARLRDSQESLICRAVNEPSLSFTVPGEGLY